MASCSTILKNGIRHTGMPAWTLPDRKLWQLSAYLRNLPRVAALSPQMARRSNRRASRTAHYVGSVACKKCHTEIYDRWKKTRMANVVQDPHTRIPRRSFRICPLLIPW